MCIRDRACTPHDLVIEAKSQIKEIQCAAAQKLLNEGVLTIDVREHDEFVGGHLPGALNIPRGLLEFMIGNLPQAANKQVPVVLYCKSGGRSALSAVQLQRLGYTDVCSLAGGFEQWSAEALPANKPAPTSFD